MGLFKDMLGSEESVFQNELALDYSFIPKIIPYREQEQRSVAAAIRPLFHERTGRNVLIYGPSGVGKTVACKHLADEIEQETDDIIPIYVNCWKHSTSFRLLLEICDIIGYKFTQNKRTDELFTIVKQQLNKGGAVFIFDEVDKIEDVDFIYTLVEEIYRKSIVLITNHKEWLIDLDNRIRSRLTPELLEFKPYTAQEIHGILRDRMQFAFVPGVWENDAFEKLAAKAGDLGDVRQGLYLMREAGNAAEDRASKKIELVDAEKAIGKLEEFSVQKSTDLDDEARFVLSLIKKNSGEKIGQMFKLYEEAGGKASYRTFQRTVARLERGKFISTNKITGGTEGTTTIINHGKQKPLTQY